MYIYYSALIQLGTDCFGTHLGRACFQVAVRLSHPSPTGLWILSGHFSTWEIKSERVHENQHLVHLLHHIRSYVI